MDIIKSYQEHVDALFAKVRETQMDKIREAGKMMADAMCAKKNIVVHDTGHIINGEMIQRSGGLIAPKMLRYYLVTEDDGLDTPAFRSKNLNMEGMAELVYRCSHMTGEGDILFIGSVSGRSDQVVDLALTCKSHGVKIIAVTSLDYSSNVKSAHTSGKRLYEIADLVIDNCAPLGDGMMDIPGFEMPFAPASGISAVYIMWQVYAACIEEMDKRGLKPGILKSSNTPGGDEYNLELEHLYQERGY